MNTQLRRTFANFLVASLFTMAAIQLSTIINGLMLSHFICDEAMGCVNLSRPVTQLIYAISVVLGNGGSMLAGIAIGKGDRKKANRIFTVTVAASAVVGLLLSVVGTAYISPLTSFLCSEASLSAMTGDFLSVMIWGAAPMIGSTVLGSFVTVDGSPRRVTVSVATGAAVLVLLDWVFIALCGWGVRGAAFSTCTSYIVSALTLIPHLRKRTSLKITRCVRLSDLSAVLNIGLPFGVSTTLIAFQIWGSNSVVLHYLGESGIVALSVCFYLLSFSMIFLSGTLKTLQPLASVLKGKGDTVGALRVIWYSYCFLAASLAVYSVPQLFFPDFIAWLFGVTGAVNVSVTLGAIPLYCFNILLQCLVNLLMPIYQLYGNKPLAYLLSVAQPLAPVAGLWIFFRQWPSLCWLGCAAGQFAVLAVLVCVTEYKRRRSATPLLPILLMPKA